MKEYKIIKAGFFKKEAELLEQLNQSGREGWHVVGTASDSGTFIKIMLERDKNRMS